MGLHTTHASFLREPGGGGIHFVLQDEVFTPTSDTEKKPENLGEANL